MTDSVKQTLNRSFDRLSTNAQLLIAFAVRLPNVYPSGIDEHEQNQLVDGYLHELPGAHPACLA